MTTNRLVTRTVPLEDISIRGDGRTVDAYAAVFMVPAEIMDEDGHYKEQNHPASFNRSIANQSSVRVFCLYNHGKTLAGTPSDRYSVPIAVPVPGAMKADRKGLFTSSRYNNDPEADRILEAIKSGSLTGMSYTGVFRRSDPELTSPYERYAPDRNGNLPLVTRLEIALIEYGPTPIPAFGDAQVLAVRSTQGSGTPIPRMCAFSGEVTYGERCGTCGSPSVPIGTPRVGAVSAGPAVDLSGSVHVVPKTTLGSLQGHVESVQTGHAEYNGLHSHAHDAAHGPDPDGDGVHQHPHEHDRDSVHDHDHRPGLFGTGDSQATFGNPPADAGGVAGAVSSSGRSPTDPASRAEWLREWDDNHAGLHPDGPDPPPERWPEDAATEEAMRAQTMWDRCWERLCDLRDEVPTHDVVAQIRELEGLEATLRARKETAASRLASIQAELDRHAVPLSYPETNREAAARTREAEDRAAFERGDLWMGLSSREESVERMGFDAFRRERDDWGKGSQR